MTNQNHQSQTNDDGDDKLGLIVLLIFVLGLPLLGILAKLLGYY